MRPAPWDARLLFHAQLGLRTAGEEEVAPLDLMGSYAE
jgi:hypothetical protein